MPDDYIPQTEGELLEWTENLSENIVTDGPTIGLTPADIDTTQGSCKSIADVINNDRTAKTAAAQASKLKKSTINANVKILRGILQEAKRNPGYTEDIGAHLDILRTHSGIDPDTYAPVIEGVVFPGHVTIKFIKDGVEGVNIYTRLQGQTIWVKLSYDSHSPYVDNRPLSVANTAETREYMAIGVIDDEEVGQMSKTITVVFGG